MRKTVFKILTTFFSLLMLTCGASFVLGATFAGTTYYSNGTEIPGANVTVQALEMGPTGENVTYTNSSLSNSGGAWSVSIPNASLEGPGRMVKFIPKKYNGNDVEWIGSVLNGFPYMEMQMMMNLSDIKFYLKEGLTVNVTAVGRPEKFQNANITQNISDLNMSIVSAITQIEGLEFDNTTERFAYLVISEDTNSLIWLNSSFSDNSSYPLNWPNLKDLEIYNGNEYFILNGSSHVKRYLINSSNQMDLVYNSTYDLNSSDFTNLYSIEYDYCNTTNNLFYVFGNNAGPQVIYKYNFSTETNNFTYISSYNVNIVSGKLERYDCNSWLISNDGSNGGIMRLDNNFIEMNNAYWESSFQVNGIERVQGAANVNDSIYVIDGLSNKSMKIQLYGGTAQSFNYMVKDTKLGYGIAEGWQSSVSQVSIDLPADRNYSIEIFPNQAMPIYYDLNATGHREKGENHVDVVFNTTSSPIRVTGRVNLSNGTGAGFDEFFIANYLMEPGDMVFAGQSMPFNMSAWQWINNTPGTDIFSTSDGAFNITLEGTTMLSKVLMMPVVKVGDQYFVGFRNISPAIDQNVDGFNFILYETIGQIPSGLRVQDGGAQGEGDNYKYFTLDMTNFTFVNSTAYLTDASGHLEVELEYSNFDSQMPDFTWMVDVSQDSPGSFTLPLINYSVKKVNMFAMDYAPLKLSFTAAQLDTSGTVNITLRSFENGGIGDETFEDVLVGMYKSSSTCDVPNPEAVANCTLASSEAQENFKPLNAVIGGGKISFRITKSTNNITVHYVNVDLIASGPPDAMFDGDSNNTASGSSLEQAWRFGSAGPEIYDSIILGIPYNESQVDETKPQTILIKHLYDAQTWEAIWNSSDNLNGLNATGTFSDYANFDQSWFNASYGSGGMSCQDVSNFNVNNQGCYTDTSSNINWLVIPHFSGLGPQITGVSNLGTITSDKTVYSCYPSCTAYVNITVNNSNLVGVQNITLNNTAMSSGLTYKISYYNNTDSQWYYTGDANANNTKVVDFNLTLEANQFMINITMPVPLSTKWNFSISLNGSSTYYTLDPYLDAINLTSPDNGASTTDSTPDFSFVLYSNNWTTQSCDLIINTSYYRNNASVANGSATTLTANASLLDGTYSWYIGCNVTGNSETRTLTVGVSPGITLYSPVNGANVSNNTQAVTFIAVDNEGSNMTCNLTVDGSVNASGISATSGSQTTQIINGTLVDGTHYWNVTCWDIFNNVNVSATYNFIVDTLTPNAVLSSPANNSNMTTASTPIVVNVSDATSGVKTLQYYSSCDSTVRTFINATGFYTFNNSGSSCTGAGNRALTINVTDHAGNSNVTVYLLRVDDTAPATFTIASPASGQQFAGLAEFNWTNISDSFLTVHTFGYYLDGKEPLVILGSNANATNNKTTINFTAGTHSVKFWANDTVGNSANHTSISFKVIAPYDMTGFANNLTAYIGGGNISAVTVKLGNGTAVTGNQWVNQTFEIIIDTNTTGTNMNVSLVFNGLNANWNNNFTITSNDAASKADIQANWTTTVVSMVRFDSTIDNFLPNTSAYYGTVIMPYNASNSAQITNIWWFSDESSLGTSGRTAVSSCSGTYSITNTTPCYNVTGASSTTVYLPHFSVVVAANDTGAPSLTVNKPSTGNNSVSTFAPNISVSLDATTCNHNASGSNATASPSSGLCIFSAVSYRNGENYSITFYATDSAGNTNETTVTFNMSDTTSPGISGIKNSSITSSGAVITWNTTEYANATVNYGTNALVLSSPSSTTTFSTMAQSITLSGLSASTIYYYNVSSCDYAGNCNTSGVSSFNTSAADQEEETTDGGSSGGGGGASATATTNIEAKVSRYWASIPAGEATKMQISHIKIGFTEINFNAKNTLSQVNIEANSLKEKPSSVKNITGKSIYQYLEIKTTNIDDADIEDAKITFRVPFTWFTENNVDPSTVQLNRYKDSNWMQLTTSRVRSDSTQHYYEASTPGFSYFAITGASKAAAVAAEGEPAVAEAAETAEEAGEQEAAAAAGAEQEGAAQKAKRGKTWIILIVIAALVLAAMLTYYIIERRKQG